MNIEELQTEVKTRIEGDPNLAGIPVLIDEGQFPQIPARETHLRDHGLVIAILPPECLRASDEAPEGTFLYTAGVPIVVDENVAKNRSITGRPTAPKVARLLKERLQGALGDSSPGTGLMPVDPWFKHLGRVNGLQRVVVMFAKQFA